VGTSAFARVAAGAVAGLLIVGAIAVAGCGGGTSSTSTAAGGATTSTTNATPGFDPNHVPKSTAIASTGYFNALVQAFSQSGKLSKSQAESAAHCIQDGLTKAGFKTQGDAEGANAKQAVGTIYVCVQKAQSQ
jgi:hypothetical protein